MRVLLTGGSGLLGRMMLGRKPADIEVIAVRHRREVTGADRTLTADLTDQVAVARMMERLRPDLVVHLAYAKASRPGIVDATAHLVSAATPLVLASTDNVFAGDGRPVAEHHPPDPVNDYGRWKAEAEALVLTFERSGVVRLPLLIDRAGLDDTSRAVRARCPEMLVSGHRVSIDSPAQLPGGANGGTMTSKRLSVESRRCCLTGL